MKILHRIIGISVGLVVAGLLVPMGINSVANATLYNVDPAVSTLFSTVIPVIACIAIVLYFLTTD